MYGNEFDYQAFYAAARCEQFLRDFSETNGVAFNELGKRVAEFLHSKTGGETRGTDDRMSPLRDTGTEGDQATREVAVDDRPHRNAQVGKSRPCPHCGVAISPRQMGNHIRYSHTNKAKAAGKPTLAKIMALRKKGHSWSQIGAAFKVGTNAVWYMAKKAGQTGTKANFSPKGLQALRQTAAHAREVKAARRKALTPTQEPKIGSQVAEAMAQYRDAVSTESAPVGANGMGV